MIRRIWPKGRFGYGAGGLAVACALALGGPALAQGAENPPPPPDSQIVVNGAQQTEQEVRAQASAMVRKLGVAAGERPASRWRNPVCPMVFGLAPEHAGIVTRKLAAIAKAANVPMAQEGCQTNIAISFVGNGGDFIRTMTKAGASLAELSRADRDRLLKSAWPVGWWYATETLGYDGAKGQNGVVAAYKSSLVSSQSIRVIRTAVIVVDVPKATGVKLSALASYIAMVALAEVDYATEPSPDSILSLFTTGKDLPGLTALDSAFLSALYKLPLDRQAFQIRNALRTSITDQVVGDK